MMRGSGGLPQCVRLQAPLLVRNTLRSAPPPVSCLGYKYKWLIISCRNRARPQWPLPSQGSYYNTVVQECRIGCCLQWQLGFSSKVRL